MAELTIGYILNLPPDEREDALNLFILNAIGALHDALEDTENGVMSELHNDAYLRGAVCALTVCLHGDPEGKYDVKKFAGYAKGVSYLSRMMFLARAERETFEMLLSLKDYEEEACQ